MSARHLRIAVVAGDGIGPEVIAEARRAAEASAQIDGASIEWVEYPFSGAHYLKTNEILPDSALSEMASCDAMLLGAVGRPDVKPGMIERGLLLKLRFHFDQYVNLRPAVSLPNVPVPVPLKSPLDSVVVRENTEDLYMGLGAIAQGSCSEDMALERGGYSLSGRLDLSIDPQMPFAAQVAINTKLGVERITRYACRLALERGEKSIAIATKSNAAPALYGFFEDTARALASAEFPELSCKTVNVDAMCYHLVRDPAAYGVLLCPNLFGDIVSDLQAGLAGGMGTAAGGNIGDGLSMFEPVHGSAPDIAGTGRANPVAAIMCSALMLRHVGLPAAAKRIEDAVKDHLRSASDAELPIEFGGTAVCSKVGELVLKRITK